MSDYFYDYDEEVPAAVKALCESGSAAEFSVRLAAYGGGFTAADFIYMAENVEDEGAAEAMAKEVLDGSAFDDALCGEPYFDLDYYMAAAMDRKSVDPDQYVKFPVLEKSLYIARRGHAAAILDAAARKLVRLFGRGVKSVNAFRRAYVAPALARKEYKR